MLRHNHHGCQRRWLLPALTTLSRAYHYPGWKTQNSTKDARSREQRESDRKARQIEKLPRPEALHDFQYPHEKTVLSDYMFQHPVYDNELDTPQLFNLTPPPNFFVYWNVSDFDRTAYPSVPKDDHRLLIPSAQSERWQQHRQRAQKYLEKHEVVPNYLPQVGGEVNLSVVFPGQYQSRARRVDEITGEPIPLPPPETELHARNFWFTSHCGNYMDLCELQQPPSIFFVEEEEVAAAQSEPNYYTLLIFSPDYPYRRPSYEEREPHAAHDDGFFLNYMVANLPGNRGSSGLHINNHCVVGSDGIIKSGDVVVPWVPPLPTEDAGTTRHICALFRQTNKVDNVVSLSAEDEERHFPLAVRSSFRLGSHSHTNTNNNTQQQQQGEDGTAALPAALSSLRRVERVLAPTPSAATFFQTKWDIQVQEFYEAHHLPEPAAPVDEEIEALLEFHAKPSEAFRVRARHRPDGSTNMGNDPNFWGQSAPTQMMDGTMQSLWSRRTAIGKNDVPVVYPH